MPRVFISYRRADTRPTAGRLADHLSRTLGEENVFRDVDSTEPGRDFREALGKALDSADATLVLIGPQWLDQRGEAGRRRLDDPTDFVRLEVQAALARPEPVIPVLVEDARMPAPRDLPRPLRALTFRQAAHLRDADFAHHAEQLTAFITGAEGPGMFGWRPRRYLGNAALLAALVTLLVAWPAIYAGGLQDTAVAGLLAGLAAGIGVVARLLPEHTRRRTRRWIEQHVFLHPRSRPVLAGLFIALSVAGSCLRSLEISVRSTDEQRPLQYLQEDTVLRDAGRLTGNGRVDLFLAPPWSALTIVVSITGLPRQTVSIWPWQRATLMVPDSFQASVVLVRCEHLPLANASANDPRVRFRLVHNGTTLADQPYSGKTLCLGMDAAMDVPDSVREQWLADLEELRRGMLAFGDSEPDADQTLQRLEQTWHELDTFTLPSLQEDDDLRVDVFRRTATGETPLGTSGNFRVEAASDVPQTVSIEELEE